MIGVVANPSQYAVVKEFFELFKTPWEFYQPESQYDVLLCAWDGVVPKNDAKMLIIYASYRLPSEVENDIEYIPEDSLGRNLLYQESRIPIYGSYVTFANGGSLLVDEESRSAIHLQQSGAGVLVRVGYDLFEEVRTLLTDGQPAANADSPTLELHVGLLRDLILDNGISLVEIPPVPAGYQFIACLTHDVDHPSLRMHKLDRTALGFLYRAFFGSLVRACQGRLSLRDLLRIWMAALKLPLVWFGFAKDPWSQFDDYPRLERGCASSFFVIPFRGDPGSTKQGPAPRLRASAYGAMDIADHIQTLLSTGCEVGVHGIDAWRDRSKGRQELERLQQPTGAQDIGVRMHWLYFDQESPTLLEEAGFAYDSTIGYNETIGYRAGTTQVYKHLQTAQLFELPLHIMDTALFFPCYLDLAPAKARERVQKIIDQAVRWGGCVTVNWHDRSIAPERQWGDFYVELVEEMERRGAWFSTASQVVAWFRKRRSAVFEDESLESGHVRVNAPNGRDDLPDLQVRVHNAQDSQQNTEVAACHPCTQPTAV